MSEKDLSYNQAFINKVRREASQKSFRAAVDQWFDSQPKLTTEQLEEGRSELRGLIHELILEDMSKRNRPSDN